MIENFEWYKDTYNIISIDANIDGLFLCSGNRYTHFINGNPDITEDVTFIGKDHSDDLIFLKKDGSVAAIDDTENIF